jgi:hypothetical protein
MKKTKTFPILLTIAATMAILFSACCKGDAYCKDDTPIKQEIPVTGKILGVIIEGPWDVSITQDSLNNDAMIEYPACAKNNITAELRSNGYLHIKVRKAYGSHNSFRATINATALENIDGSGATRIRTYKQFYSVSDITLSGASTLTGLMSIGGNIRLSISGASTIRSFTYDGNQMDAAISGASNVSLSEVNMVFGEVNCSGASTFEGRGYAAKTIFTGSGASTFKTLNLESENLDVDFSGATKGEVTVNSNIRGRLSGASVLKYRKATHTNVEVSGGSQLIRLD